MILDSILFLAPVVIYVAAAFPAIRYPPMSQNWRPPSSRLTLLGLVATLLLTVRHFTMGRLWGAAGALIAVFSMLYAYRVAVRAEASYRSYQQRRTELDG